MVELFNRVWSKAELVSRVGQMEQLAGVRMANAAEGKALGSRLIDVWTGSGLRFQINAERALDITSCDFKGIPLGWRSPVGVVHPAYFEPDGLGWLHSFTGGLLTTCGLDQFGLPCQENGEDFGLHGRISNTPAVQVGYKAGWVGDEYELSVSGEIRQTRFFGENLVLRRRIVTHLGSAKLRIEDQVTNEGFEPAPHMILYHFNLGFPLLTEHTRLQLQAEESAPRDDAARSGFSEWAQFQLPTPGYAEQVFIHRLAADKDGFSRIELVNPDLKLGMCWSYLTHSLPYMMEWKMMGMGAYVVGVEPANCNGLAGRVATKAKGDLLLLEPGESRDYAIELEIIQES